MLSKVREAILLLFSITLFVAFTGCGGGDEATKKKSNAEGQESGVENTSGLTDFQLKNGIGPVTEPLKLSEKPDPAKVAKGEALFKEKCETCHKLDEKLVGPAQRDVIERRTPEYIVNMIMNPAEMLEKHPEAKKMLPEYLTPMTYQDVTLDQALDILEYFRSVDPKNK
ncbi:MAG: c-type cytochrome [Ignavibacteriaceae bacterium]|nr:MAG: c-type cytochrome [Ignavibacteriaceae bacterium]